MNSIEIEGTFNIESPNVDSSQEDYFHNINKPSKKKKNLADFKKINTKMSTNLHRELKVYCGKNDVKKNAIFKETLILYMTNISINEADGVYDSKSVEEKVKKDRFNFEIPLNLFKEVKAFAFARGYQLATFYEEAIRYYLKQNTNRTDS